MNNFIVYLHKNKINNKVYIGQTCKNVQARWRSGQGYYKQPRFYEDIQKYGWNNFEHIILAENLTQEEANILEKKYIEQYQARDPEFGYNIHVGGRSIAGENNPMYGRHHSEETKQKIREAYARRDPEYYQKLKESAQKRLLRDGPPFKGKHLSQEAKDKISKANKNKTVSQKLKQVRSINAQGGKNSQAKKVKAFSVEDAQVLIFSCKKEALKFLQLSRSSAVYLNKAIKNHTIYHGYYWEEMTNE